MEKILPGMNSAFVNCGLERNCYLSADDVPLDKSRYDGGGENPVFPDIKEGDEIVILVSQRRFSRDNERLEKIING